MKTFNVIVSEQKASFFKEFLNMIGVEYTEINQDFELSEEQKTFLDSQDNVDWAQCTNHEDFIKELKAEYGV